MYICCKPLYKIKLNVEEPMAYCCCCYRCCCCDRRRRCEIKVHWEEVNYTGMSTEEDMEEKRRLLSQEMPETAALVKYTESSKKSDNLRPVSCSEKISLLLLVFINFINYMDRLTIAGKNQPYICSARIINQSDLKWVQVW